MGSKTIKLAAAMADKHISRVGASKAYGGREAVIQAYMPVAEIQLLIQRNGKRMSKALAANAARIDALKAAWESPAPVPAFVPEDIEAKVDGMVNRQMNGFSHHSEDMMKPHTPPIWHPEYGPEKP